MHRANADADSVEDHYRINFYIPFLDHVLVQLKERFSQHFSTVTQLSCLVPGMRPRPYLPCGEKEIKDAVNLYSSLVDETRVYHELKSWNAKWMHCSKDERRPESAVHTLEFCDPNFYPNLFKLLTILATLPVTTASAERSFSTRSDASKRISETQ
jgi:hypothetical protein